jgi:probable rRNA maturation factor
MTRPAAIAHTIDVIVAAPAWTRSLSGARAIAKRAAAAALAAKGPKRTAELSVVLTGDAVVRRLNALYRGKNKPTNVLSFPAEAPTAPPRGVPRTLGDVVLAYGVAAREAKSERKTLKAHLSHLVVHGVLHLLGYDHEHDAEASAMERLEKKILSELGIADPYSAPPPARPQPRADARRVRPMTKSND